jgi:hypothetical protein
MRRLKQKYGKYDLQVVQAHSAEYHFATDHGNIRRALKHYNVDIPNAFDTGNKTWEAYGNMYWPKHVLVDHNGFIRYEHAGYGGIADFEDSIVEPSRTPATRSMTRTACTFMAWRRRPA